MTAESWMHNLEKEGEVIVDEALLNTTEMKIKQEKVFAEKDMTKEFRGKKELCKYYGLKLKDLPQGFTIKSRVLNEKGKRTRVYKFVKVDE